MEFSPMHIFLVLLIVLVLFGGRKLPELMRGLGQGIREFKDGMRDPAPTNPPPSSSTPVNPPPAAPTEPKK
jgi:sec-independent protein translocase protein TatA